MKNNLLLAAALSVALATAVNASTVGFGPIPTARTVRNASATALNNTSSLVWAGTFSSLTFSLNSTLSLSSNVAAVMAAGGWNQFGLDTSTGLTNDGAVSTLGISATGKIGGQVQDNGFGATGADFFNGKSLYLWVFNASTVQAATEMGIYRASGATPPWTFATNAGGVGDSNTYSTTSSAAPSISAIGGFGATTSSSFQLTNSFSITAVPEPATGAFGLLTGLTAVCIRRRRN